MLVRTFLFTCTQQTRFTEDFGRGNFFLSSRQLVELEKDAAADLRD
jgi:hypothetical protein